MTGNSLWLIFTMLAQGVLALGLLWYLGMIRIPLVLRGKVRIEDMALSREPWPEHEKRVSNAFDNQFQLPVLFYLACLVAIGFGATLFEVGLAALFVLSRYVHAFIHITSNHVVRRFQVYVAGFAVLCVFWADLLVRLLLVAFGAP
jgi:hypothetical protein